MVSPEQLAQLAEILKRGERDFGEGKFPDSPPFPFPTIEEAEMAVREGERELEIKRRGRRRLIHVPDEVIGAWEQRY